MGWESCHWISHHPSTLSLASLPLPQPVSSVTLSPALVSPPHFLPLFPSHCPPFTFSFSPSPVPTRPMILPLHLDSQELSYPPSSAPTAPQSHPMPRTPVPSLLPPKTSHFMPQSPLAHTPPAPFQPPSSSHSPGVVDPAVPTAQSGKGCQVSQNKKSALPFPSKPKASQSHFGGTAQSHSPSPKQATHFNGKTSNRLLKEKQQASERNEWASTKKPL